MRFDSNVEKYHYDYDDEEDPPQIISREPRKRAADDNTPSSRFEREYNNDDRYKSERTANSRKHYPHRSYTDKTTSDDDDDNDDEGLDFSPDEDGPKKVIPGYALSSSPMARAPSPPSVYTRSDPYAHKASPPLTRDAHVSSPPKARAPSPLYHWPLDLPSDPYGPPMTRTVTTSAAPSSAAPITSNYYPVPYPPVEQYAYPQAPPVVVQPMTDPAMYAPSPPVETKPTYYSNPPQWHYAQIDPGSVRYTGSDGQKPKDSAKRSSASTLPVRLSTDNDTGHKRSHSLTVPTAQNFGDSVTGSPLLEPYRGTYQSISPMPSPIMVPTADKLGDDDDDVSDLNSSPPDNRSGRRRSRKRSSLQVVDARAISRSHSRHGSGGSGGSGGRNREDGQQREEMLLVSPTGTRKDLVPSYDPVPDAKAVAEALDQSPVDVETLIRILPHLDDDEMLELRREYKNMVKVHGMGINMAKHIRLKLGSSSSLGKVCYATALGRWESEAFWANCYYQSSTSRRELLIECLMGRTNAEIRQIKECFRDSRYANNLETCMRTELKTDKFRMAVLLALEGRRQGEREPMDRGLVRRDVEHLHRALVSRDGSETAMIHIVLLRNDNHLREILFLYEYMYGDNFTRAMLKKSSNLVV